MAINCKEFEAAAAATGLSYIDYPNIKRLFLLQFYYNVHVWSHRKDACMKWEYVMMSPNTAIHQAHNRIWLSSLSRSFTFAMRSFTERKSEHTWERERESIEMDISNLYINENRLRFGWNNINPIFKSVFVKFILISFPSNICFSLHLSTHVPKFGCCICLGFYFFSIEREKIIYRSLSRLRLLPRCSFIENAMCTLFALLWAC